MKLNRTQASRLLALLALVVVSNPACRKPSGNPPPLDRTNLCPATGGNTTCQQPPGTGVTTGAIAGGAGAGAAASGSLGIANTLLGRNSSNLQTAPGEGAVNAEYATGAASGLSEPPKPGTGTAESLRSNAVADRGGSGGGAGGLGMGAGAGSLGLGTGNMRTAANEGGPSGPSDAELKALRDDAAGAGAAGTGGGGGAGGAGGGSSNPLAALFGGGEGGGLGDAAAKAAISFLSASGEVSPMGTPDPADYFSRFNPNLSLFQVVSIRYQKTTLRWPLEDAQRTLLGVRGVPVTEPPTRAPASAQPRAAVPKPPVMPIRKLQ